MATKKKATSEAKPTAEATPIPVTPRDPGLRIFAMQLENIKRVSFARIRPKSDVVLISGANESGKSTILDAIEWGITGTEHMPSQPIKRGKNYASIQIDLGDYKLERLFSRVDPDKSSKGLTYVTKLILRGRNREIFPTPQSLLDGFMGKISFDPLEFIRMNDGKQLETLRSLVTLDVDLDELEREKKEAYEARRDARRDVDNANARLEAMPLPADGLPERPLDTAELIRQIETASNHNSVIASQKQAKQRKLEEAQRIEEHVSGLHREIARLRQQILNLEEQVGVSGRLRLEMIGEADAMTFAEEVNVSEVSAKLTEAQKTNADIQRREAYNSVKRQVEQAEARWKELDDTVKAKDKERADAIARAKMPIEGLSIGDGEVLFDGLPFSQASNGKQIEVSVSLAMASNPKLRVLRIKDGSLLDEKRMAQIAEMAVANGYQVWVERIDAGAMPSVVMEDGEASGDEVEVVTR